ncbi:glutamate-rich protein 3-like isoform X3 [Mya arenaria]|uniref:glutamate-rich protein 3-like isoform X3 n=1 Tax=Mya arenaria TaxID=6604 RepID=UPI0022E37413|nr:glutamate-rich protein 3-like isoform X3 [Mya arenaria]
MSHIHDGPLATYNSLTDPNLSGYFGNTRMRRHLRKSGLVTRRGEIVGENQYRLNMARKEHKKHVKDLLAQAIVHKTLDLERYRQVEIKKKLEEISKIEVVRRVRLDRRTQQDASIMPLLSPKPRKTSKNSRGRKGDEEVLPYLTPRSQSRPQSGPSDISSTGKRPKSAPAHHRQRHSKTSGYTDPYDEVIYVDDNGRPMTPPPASDRPSYKGSLRDGHTDNIDTRHLYALDSEALQQYALRLSKSERGRDGATSPYLISAYPTPPKRERTRSARVGRHSPRRSARMSARPEYTQKRSSGVKFQAEQKNLHSEGALMLHRQEPAMMHQGEVQTLCEITMKYHGPNLTLPRDQRDPTQEVHIEQQHCGGNTLPVFRERLQAGSTFSFVSRRHRGYPFSLTLYIDGRMDCRVSTCCEYKHGVGVKLGGKMGHFSLTGITGATPCYKCKLSCQAPPRSIKLKKGAQKKNQQPQAHEEVTVEGTPRTPIKEKKKQPKEEIAGKSDDDNYDDDFEEEEDSKEKYADDFEHGDEDRRHIIGLRDDEHRVNGETVLVDVQQKEEKEGALPPHRRIEGYSSEDEDAEGRGMSPYKVKADIHADKGGKRSRSVSSSSSSSRSRSRSRSRSSSRSRSRSKSSSRSRSRSSSSDRTPRKDAEDHVIQARPRSPEPKETKVAKQEYVVDMTTARSEEGLGTARSTTSTTSGDLTTETEATSDRMTPKPPAEKKSRSASSSSSSTLTSDSEDEKYSRKKRDNKIRKENEQRRLEEEKQRKEEQMKREKERQEKLENDESRRKAEEEERQKRFMLQRNESQERLRKMEEERKKRLEEERGKKEEHDQAKEEEKQKRLAEETRMKQDYERQLNLIKSQRDSDTATSVSDEQVKPSGRRLSSSSSSSSSSFSSESEKEKKTQKVSEQKSLTAVTVSSSSSDTSSSTSNSDNEQKQEQKSDPMKHMTTISEEAEKKPKGRRSSTSSTGSTSSSSGGEYVVRPNAKKISATSSSSSSEDDNKAKPTTPAKSEAVRKSPSPPTVAKKSSSSSSSSSSSESESSSRKSKSPSPKSEQERPVTAVQSSRTRNSSSSSSTTSTGSSESESDAKPVVDKEPSVVVTRTPLEPEMTLKATLYEEEAVKQVEEVEENKAVHKGMSKEETEDSSSDSSSGSSSDSSDTESDLGDKQPPGGRQATTESEQENTYGGHDPDSVASPGLGMLSPKTHYGSILPMVKGESSVDLSGVKLDEAQVMELSTFIKERDHIREVTLCNTALTDTMFTSLAQSLQASQSSFYLLNLGVNNLGPKSVTQLAPVIKNQAGLKVIILNGNPIGNVGSKLLCDALTKTKDPFPFLRRSSGYLTPSEARKQADEGQAVKYDNSAEEGCNIKQMDLGDCKIGDAGIAEISRFLESNKTLTSLNLNGNKEISPSGWERLGQAFKKNTTLKNLSLDHTDIGDAGIESLAKGLRVNIGLRSLELEHNALTEKGGQILRDLVRENTSIIDLTIISGNQVSENMQDEIKKYLALNKNLVS